MESTLHSVKEAFYRLSVLSIEARNQLLASVKDSLITFRADILKEIFEELQQFTTDGLIKIFPVLGKNKENEVAFNSMQLDKLLGSITLIFDFVFSKY